MKNLTLQRILVAMAMALTLPGVDGADSPTTTPSTTPAPESTTPPPTPFTTILRAHWEKWVDKTTGTITPDRLDQLIKKHDIHGDAAAALAALKLREREKLPKPKPSTAGTAAAPAPAKPKEPAPFITITMKRIEEYESLVAQHHKQNGYDKAFEKAKATIQADPHKLYADGAPHMNTIHQSRNGDCWLLSTIAAMVHRNPGDVRKLITEDGEGQYAAHFAYHTFKVKAPTDAEIAAYTADKTDGDWLYVLENAMGQYREHYNNLHKVKVPNDDALVGGGGLIAFQDILGHNADHISLTPQDPKLNLIRKSLTQAFKRRRLVTIGTPGDETIPLPRGISHCHALALIGWHPAKDEVTIRNPIGATFEPKGTGPLDGFKTVDGVFTVSLTEFSHIFINIDIENDTPYKPDKPKKK